MSDTTLITKRHAARMLRRAALLIERGSWARGTLTSFPNSYCAIGALWESSGPVGVGPEALVALVATVKNLNNIHSLTEYNDVIANSGRDIQRLFRRTARMLEHGASLG